MSEIPSELRYTQDHEWIREEDDGSVVVGITDHAQTALGDLVFRRIAGGRFHASGGRCLCRGRIRQSGIRMCTAP